MGFSHKRFMISARSLERHFTDAGFTATKLDLVTRSLREAKRIPTAGRGLYAARIDAGIAAAMLVAYLGSSKGVTAAARLEKLEKARSDKGELMLDVVRNLLSEPIDFKELRISRIGVRGRLVFTGGETVWFSKTGKLPPADRIDVEGVVGPTVIKNIAAALAGKNPTVQSTDEQFDAE